MHDALDTVAVPLNALTDADLVPGNAALAASTPACDRRRPASSA